MSEEQINLFCPKCGKEIADDSYYCLHCGTVVRQKDVTYVQPRSSGINLSAILLIIIGGIIMLSSFGITLGGGAILRVQDQFSDSEGFLTTKVANFQVDSYALVIQDIDIDLDTNTPVNVWNPIIEDLITVRLIATNNEPVKSFFIGIARSDDTSKYFEDIEYHSIDDFRWSYQLSGEPQTIIRYNKHQGGDPNIDFSTAPIWESKSTGEGTQVIEWIPKIGSYWVVVMNTDGSPNIDVDMKASAKIPILRTIGNIMITGGIIGLLLGGFILYYGLRMLR